MRASLPTSEIGADEARRAVEDVLSRSEYADLAPGLLERILEQILTALGRLLDQLGATPAGTWVGTAALIAVLALTALLLVRFLLGTRRDPRSRDGLSSQIGRSPQDWEAEADDHERAGALADALRCRYRALVASLAAAGIVDEIPGRTATEYAGLIARRLPEAGEAIRACTRAFEAAWYGDEPVDPAQLREFAERAGRVRAAIPGSRPAVTAGA